MKEWKRVIINLLLLQLGDVKKIKVLYWIYYQAYLSYVPGAQLLGGLSSVEILVRNNNGHSLLRFNSVFFVEFLSFRLVSCLLAGLLDAIQGTESGWPDCVTGGTRPLSWDLPLIPLWQTVQIHVPAMLSVTVADELGAPCCLACSGPWEFGLFPAIDGAVDAAECLTHLPSVPWPSLHASQAPQQATLPPKESRHKKNATQSFFTACPHCSLWEQTNLHHLNRGSSITWATLKNKCSIYFHKMFDFKMPLYLCLFVLLLNKTNFYNYLLKLGCY